MEDEGKPAVVMATTGRINTLADNTLRLTVEFEPRYAKEAFAMFGTQGTSVAIALLKPEAAVAHGQKADTQPESDWGHRWAMLHKQGTFYAPELHRALGIEADILRDKLSGADIVAFVKDRIYHAYSVDSVARIDPEQFRWFMSQSGIEHILPKDF